MTRRFRDRGRAEHGFTLIEVLVTALVVTLIAGAVAGGLIAGTDYSAATHRRSEAENLAQQDQERLKGFSAAQLNNLNQSYTVTQDHTPFTINSKAWYLSSSNGQSCATGGASATYFKTISTVSRTTPAGVTETVATDESVIAPPAGGTFLAQFQDQTLSPLSGVTVAATGPDSDTATTDSNGCVIFSGLPAGSYGLTYTDAGYVDKDGNASPLSDTTSIASTGQATPNKGNPIKLGAAGGITAGFYTRAYNSAGSLLNVTTQAPELSWFGSGGSLAMSNFRTANGASGLDSTISTTDASGSAGGLFPFAALNPTSYTNNYQLWAGKCQSEQPPTGLNPASVTPGSSQGTTSSPFYIQEAPLYLVIKYNGSAIAPTTADVKITSTNGAASCSETWGPFTSAVANGPSGANVVGNLTTYVYGAPFATSSTTGSSASASGQTGSLTVCADHKVGTTWYKATQTATDSFTPPTLPLTPTVVNITTTLGQC